jgi:hypothetical protein
METFQLPIMQEPKIKSKAVKFLKIFGLVLLCLLIFGYIIGLNKPKPEPKGKSAICAGFEDFKKIWLSSLSEAGAVKEISFEGDVSAMPLYWKKSGEEPYLGHFLDKISLFNLTTAGAIALDVFENRKAADSARKALDQKNFRYDQLNSPGKINAQGPILSKAVRQAYLLGSDKYTISLRGSFDSEENLTFAEGEIACAEGKPGKDKIYQILLSQGQYKQTEALLLTEAEGKIAVVDVSENQWLDGFGATEYWYLDQTNPVMIWGRGQEQIPCRLLFSYQKDSPMACNQDERYLEVPEVPLPSFEPSKCGLESCHGLEATCGPNVPQFCTAEYQLGDKCRQYLRCEAINNSCRLVDDGGKFQKCKSCVEQCTKNHKDDIFKETGCELGC